MYYLIFGLIPFLYHISCMNLVGGAYSMATGTDYIKEEDQEQ